MFTPTPAFSTCMFAAGALLCAMPQTAYWAAAYTGRMGDPVWGPVGTHAVALLPVLYFGVAMVKELQKDNDLAGSPFQAISLPICRMAIMTLQDLWPTISFVQDASNRDLCVALGMVTLVAWVAYPFLPTFPPPGSPGKPNAPSPSLKLRASNSNLMRIALLPLLPYVFTYIQSPTLPKPLLEPYIHPDIPLRVLSSVTSPYSGVVLVGEILPPTPAAVKAGNVTEPHSLRYLRAGHSLLGGVWIADRVFRMDAQGPLDWDSHATAIGDSIYGAFVTQEAARLVQRPGASGKQNALMIGLGAGISTNAFIKHGVSTTIVEIDQAVYDAATEYFGLKVAEPEKVHITDGRGFVIQTRRALEEARQAGEPVDESGLYDYVVHDLFSGGGVPGHLFTLRFWQDLRQIIKSDAVVAVNFAGELESDSSKAVYLTLKEVFPQCRVFHDSMELLSEERLKHDFLNWIFICSPSSDPIVMRPAVEDDFLQSFLRSKLLTTLTEREVSGQFITQGMDLGEDAKKKYILIDEKNPLADWQNKEALNHWKVIRHVIPDVVWETY
ncbi:hypothetical protein PHLGIDRAFT_97360 [Phlebiopsis gigantea 11061_1 CR5-6]|uniref:PABS domain-containing protein n=1 Tax=Phlebiopsis gigantea (strain 11061_1 CR5-6) TaxID=745531 RepID=A0A0C3PXA9_PHLG1|nr:hypothetical protein PHLGIDRAFT_97360 [Phlebiopsis gigantea 11061_1 CR5-6]